ncbi:MAG: class II aldolase/adducin family protein [Coriobacteriales bacterium]|nr:class II aldolase/adducin family protein [Coriobacteriales bacterium]
MADFDFEQFKRDLLDGVGKTADAVSSAAKDAGADVRRFKEFNEVGRDLARSGAVTSHGGNLSESDGKSIWITRTGAQLGHLSPGDVLGVGWEPSERDAEASMELLVHRAIYHALDREAMVAGVAFGRKAIVHAHSRYATFRSMIGDAIRPADSEGIHVLGNEIAVLAPHKAVASEEVAQMMTDVIRRGARIAVVRAHGPFAVAESLEEAYRLVSCLEYSAELLTLFEMTGRPSA